MRDKAKFAKYIVRRHEGVGCWDGAGVKVLSALAKLAVPEVSSKAET